MRFIENETFFILLNFMWQFSLICYWMLCKNRKAITFILIIINILVYVLLIIFLKESYYADIVKFFLAYMVTSSICYIVFTISIRKFVPYEIPIFYTLSMSGKKTMYISMISIGVFCFLILVFQLLNYKNSSLLIKEYVIYSILLLINIIINIFYGLNVRRLSKNSY
jgi:hypothetical protein